MPCHCFVAALSVLASIMVHVLTSDSGLPARLAPAGISLGICYPTKQEVKERIRLEPLPLLLHLNGSAYASATSRAKPMRFVGRSAALPVDLYKDSEGD